VHYSLTLQCGCVVSIWREGEKAPLRLIDTQGGSCLNPRHRVGCRLFLWDLLPQRADHVVRAAIARPAESRRRAASKARQFEP